VQNESGKPIRFDFGGRKVTFEEVTGDEYHNLMSRIPESTEAKYFYHGESKVAKNNFYGGKMMRVRNVNGASNVQKVHDFLRANIGTDQISHLHITNPHQWYFDYSGYCVLVFNHPTHYERALEHFRNNPPVLHSAMLQVEHYELRKSRRLELPPAFAELKQRWDRLVVARKEKIKVEKEQRKTPGASAQIPVAVLQKRQKVCRDADKPHAKKPVQEEADNEILDDLAQPGLTPQAGHRVRGSALKDLKAKKNDSWNPGEGSESDWTQSVQEEEEEHGNEEQDDVEAEDDNENEKENEESDEQAAEDLNYFVRKFTPALQNAMEKAAVLEFERFVNANALFKENSAIMNVKPQLAGLIKQSSNHFLKSLASAGPARASKLKSRNVSK